MILANCFPLLLFGALYGVAARLPSSIEGAVLAVVSLCILSWGIPRSIRPGRDSLLAGIVFHAVAFSWIPATVQYFGGFNAALSYLIFALFCIVSSLQFLFFGIALRWSLSCCRVSPTVAIAGLWFVFEFLVPRMFPWALCHPLLVWPQFAIFASVVGVYPLSAL
ncbi:MAG: hypothetical protein KDD44_10075, partial [Bdellovibrionales bacterium]|nr:hypothetical protein [Bdellovibrionales bacterium]